MTASAGLYAQAMAGNVFYGTVAPSAIPINSTTSPTMILWNRSSSNFNIVLVRYLVGLGAIASDATTSLQMATIPVAGDNLATAAPISALTAVTPQNALVGGGAAPTGVLFGSAATLTAASTTFHSMGMSGLINTTVSAQKWFFQYDFDDMLILRPGTACFDVGIAATGSTWGRTLVWYQVPVSQSFPK